MKHKLLYFCILLSFCNHSIAQTHIVDIDNNTPIPFVHVISDKGIILGTSNMDGIIDFRKINASSNHENKSVSFHHISYQNEEWEMANLLNTDTVKLKQRVIAIPDIVITNKSQEPVYLVLKGFYRSYQIENGIPKYYTDGIVEYYISKNQFKNRVIQHRSFRNKMLVDAEKKRVNMVSIVAACTPYINAKTEIDELDKEYSIEKEIDKQFIKKQNAIVGSIIQDKQSRLFQVNIDLIAPETDQTRSLFNYTSKITSIDITESYSSTDFTNIIKDDLVSRKEYRKIYFKHKKDKKYFEIDVVDEFYVFDKQYLYKSDLKGLDLSSNFSLKESCSYSNEYWKEFQKYNMLKLPEYIEKLLGTTLEKY